MSSSNPFRKLLVEALGGKVESADLDKLEIELKKRYDDITAKVDQELITPRPSTVEDTLRQGEGLAGIQKKQLDEASQRTVAQAQALMPVRGGRLEQDAGYFRDVTDAQSQAALNVLGDPWSVMQRDQRDHVDGIHIRNNEYLAGRDDKLFDYLSRDQNLQERQLTQDFISRLAGTAALVFMG